MNSDYAKSPERSILPWLICSLLLFAVLLVRSLFSFPQSINHDCALYLSTGQLLLQGKIPYVDFIDINPPLIFYVNVVPAYISQVTGIDVSLIFAVCTWFLCLGGWLLGAYIICSAKDDDYRYAGPLLFGLAVFNLWVEEWGDFGQRQHLASIAIVPFMFCRWLRSKSKPIPLAISINSGVFLGFMISLVPQYLAVPASVEIVFQLRSFKLAKKLTNLFSPEILATTSSALACTISFFLLPSLAKEEYLHRWIPLIVQGYSAYNHDWFSFVLFPVLTGFIPLFFFGLYIANKYSASLSAPMMIWCVAALFAAFAQQKGWSNHFLPYFAGVILFAALQCEILAEKKNIGSQQLHILVLTILLTLCLVPPVCIKQMTPHPKTELEMIEKETVIGDNVIILSTSVADLYPPLLQAKRRNGSRYLFFFPIEMLRYMEEQARDEKAKANARQEEMRVLSDIRQDIERSRPALILVPTGPMAEYFQNNGMQDYIKQGFSKIGECAGRISSFEAWKRRK